MLSIFMIGLFRVAQIDAIQSDLQPVKVIINSTVSTSTMSLEQIRRIFSMRQTVWADKQPITVFVLNNKHQTHQTFSTNNLGMFPYQLERVWNKLVYSGLGEEPIRVNTEQEMLDRVKSKPGSIGYIKFNIEHTGVKTLNVIKEESK